MSDYNYLYDNLVVYSNDDIMLSSFNTMKQFEEIQKYKLYNISTQFLPYDSCDFILNSNIFNLSQKTLSNISYKLSHKTKKKNIYKKTYIYLETIPEIDEIVE